MNGQNVQLKRAIPRGKFQLQHHDIRLLKKVRNLCSHFEEKLNQNTLKHAKGNLTESNGELRNGRNGVEIYDLQIGSGAYGTVYKGLLLKDSSKVWDLERERERNRERERDEESSFRRPTLP